MPPEVEGLHGGGRDGADRLHARERQHRSVVVRVAVQVEQCTAAGAGDASQHVGVAALADVDHALEHRRSLPRGRCPGTGGGW